MTTHSEKVLFPVHGITKGELASYYDAMAPIMLPHIRGRPVTMERYPAGIGEPGFFQKDVSKGFPGWLSRVEVPKKNGTVHHPLVRDRRSLLWLANQNCIKPHVWTSRAPKPYGAATRQSNGSTSGTPAFRKSMTFRVTTVSP